MRNLRDIAIDLHSTTPYEAGATLLTVLAWPDYLSDAKAMGERHASICQAHLIRRASAGEAWATSPQPIKPMHLAQPVKVMQRIEKEFFRRLRDRMAAGRMVMPFLQEASGRKPKLPKGVSKLSVAEMARLVRIDAAQEREKNVETRVWRPSRPVLHVAAAAAVASQAVERVGRKFTADLLMTEPDMVGFVVEMAAEYRTLFDRIERFKIDPNELVQVRLT